MYWHLQRCFYCSLSKVYFRLSLTLWGELEFVNRSYLWLLHWITIDLHLGIISFFTVVAPDPEKGDQPLESTLPYNASAVAGIWPSFSLPLDHVEYFRRQEVKITLFHLGSFFPTKNSFWTETNILLTSLLWCSSQTMWKRKSEILSLWQPWNSFLKVSILPLTFF